MEIQLNKAYSFNQQGQRGNQEDARFPDVDVADDTFFVVCDGVGGHEAGEVASNTVCESLGRNIGRAVASGHFGSEAVAHVLRKAYDDLQAVRNEECQNMATTMTMLVFHEGGVTMSHIGDSRIYQFRKDEGIHYRSKDHSLVQELVSIRQLTEEQARVHPQSNIITRCMSANSKEYCPATTMITTDVDDGDIFLLCTDGVLSEITDAELQELFLGDGSDEDKMRRLSEICRDSSDNNTATMVSVANVLYGEEETIQSATSQAVDIVPEEDDTIFDRLKRFLGGR